MDRVGAVCANMFSVAMIGVGITSDATAGLFLAGNQGGRGIILHLVANLIWLIGLIIIDTRHHSNAMPGNHAIILNDKIALALVVGLFLFPGLGTLGFTLALTMTPLFGKKRTIEVSTEESPFADPLSEIRRVVGSSSDPLIELETRPLIDVLATADSKTKRAALDLVCRESGPQAMPLTCSLLADRDPDVRALAAVALSRLEADFSIRLKSAFARTQNEPLVADYVALGNLYCEYASTESANSMSRDFYFGQACRAFEQAVELEPQQSCNHIALAEVLFKMGDQQAAQDAAMRATALSPDTPAGYLLRMEIAFAQGRFNEVIELAGKAVTALPETDPALSLENWWLEARTVREAEIL